jgi:hypothetical protein
VKALPDINDAFFPAPAMIKTPAEGLSLIEALPGNLPLLDGLRLLRPRPVAPEGVGNQELSFPDRIVEAFLRRVEAEDLVLAARLPEEDLRKAARSRIMQGVVGKLLEGLDTNVLDALAWCAVPTSQERVLEWFGVWRGGPAPPEEILMRRRQVLEAAPFFAGVIPAVRQAREAVDEGRPLLPVLAETFGISASQAAAIASIRMPPIMTSGMSFRDQVRALARLPTEWLRGTRGETEARALAKLLLLDAQARECGFPPGVFTAKSGGKWGDTLQRLAKAGMDRRPPEGIQEAGFHLLKGEMPFDEIAQASPRHRRTVARFHAARFSGLVDGVTTEDIADWAARVAAPDASLDNLSHGLGMLRDMARSYACRVLLPLVLQETGMSGRRLAWDFRMELERVATDLLFRGKSGARLFEMARAYANAEPRLVAEDVDEEHAKELAKLPSPEEWTLSEDQARRFGIARMDGPSWPMIAKPVIAPNGLALVPLTCQAHLQDEGRGWNGENLNEDGSQGLSICVGTHGYYLANCLSAKNQIISIRIPSDDGRPVRRLSCVQLEISSLNDFKNVQHRGLRNCTPSREAQDAIAWWLNNIGTERIPVNPFWQDFAKKGGVSKSDKFDEARILCGYDWRKVEKLHLVHETWKDVFSKEVLCLDVARAHPDVQRMISENSIDLSLHPR